MWFGGIVIFALVFFVQKHSICEECGVHVCLYACVQNICVCVLYVFVWPPWCDFEGLASNSNDFQRTHSSSHVYHSAHFFSPSFFLLCIWTQRASKLRQHNVIRYGVHGNSDGSTPNEIRNTRNSAHSGHAAWADWFVLGKQQGAAAVAAAQPRHSKRIQTFIVKLCKWGTLLILCCE